MSLHPGKTSRHFHAVRGEGIEAFMSRGDMFLRVAGSATLTHPDHAPLTVPAGTYRVARQREYGDDRARPMFSIGVPD
ncbi:MAG TPA: hypothetical protein VM242_03445 [Acidimicrobiales bacterium]|nr:hypothetical protein [Acidimicrobiales bacterium]